jgi:hypothetical protein
VTQRLETISGVPVLFLAGAPGGGSATDLVAVALEAGARWIALSASGLPQGFLDLSSGVAGEIAQKCVNYGIGLAVVGDIGPALSRSSALRDWVRECNRGGHVGFLAGEAELADWLAAQEGT